ncbi:hypothetical protein GCM10027569_72010 [Flindersiella endophytica]
MSVRDVVGIAERSGSKANWLLMATVVGTSLEREGRTMGTFAEPTSDVRRLGASTLRTGQAAIVA